jgi:hypothetical protein
VDATSEESIIDETQAASSKQTKGASSASADSRSSTEPVQQGPLIDLLGPKLLSLELDATHAHLIPHYTTDALRDKKVIGLYFSADWYVV